jgi:hypothetical protein
MLKKLLFLISIYLIGTSTLYPIDNFGVEADLLPYVSGGNYIGGFVSENGFKYRLVRAETNLPEFILENNIDNVNLEVYAFIVDYYFDKTNYEGLWIGAGFEYWQSRIDEKNGVKDVKLNQKIFTLGGGYVFRLSDRLYVNPWVAIHVDMGSEDYKMIGNTKYKIHDILPEASIKLAYYF